MMPPAAAALTLEQATYRRVTWRLVPFLFLCYVVASLDRVNMGFAKLQMLADLGLPETVYGLGAGMFFLGYFLFDVPSNIILHRTGARIWIARILVTRGLVSSAMMVVDSAGTLYVLRFLLGVAEAGLFPGIIFYLTHWFPATRRAGVVALFMTAIAVAGVVGGPLSGWIMQSLGGVNGWAGWQWLFLLGGLPSLLVGIAVLFYLDDHVTQARWLRPEQKQLLIEQIHADHGQRAPISVAQVFGHGQVWLLALTYFCFILGLYGVAFWLPQLLKTAGVRDVLTLGLLSAVPYGLAALVMVLASHNSDRTGERRWHTTLVSLAGALGLLASGWAGPHLGWALAAMSLAAMGCLATLPLFWTLPTALLRGSAAAAGLALVNAIGNLAGFFSPLLVGAIKDTTGSVSAGLYVLAAGQALGSVLVWLTTRGLRRA